jgi:hypothetical protein
VSRSPNTCYRRRAVTALTAEEVALPAWMVLLTLAGCGGAYKDEADFREDYFQLFCQASEECYPEDFEASFESVDACVDGMNALMTMFSDDGTMCGPEFDGALARDCIQEAQKLSCEELETATRPECEQACPGESDV